MATTAPTTRRAAFATLGAGVFTSFARPAGAGEPFRPDPTELGRRFLRYAALVRLVWTGQDPNPVTLALDAKFRDQLEAARVEILGRPVLTVADMVDRIIVATSAYGCANEIEPADMIEPLAGVLAVAGLTPGECCTDARLTADLYAGV